MHDVLSIEFLWCNCRSRILNCRIVVCRRDREESGIMWINRLIRITDAVHVETWKTTFRIAALLCSQ